jgi:ribosomal protein L3
MAADTGATGHYLGIHAKVTHKQTCTTPVTIICADNNHITSTHTAEPDIPALSVLPVAARKAHIFPQMGNISLLSIGQLCDNGCTAVFEHDRVRIYFQNEIILTGT